MPGTWSKLVTVVTGQTLTASLWNNEFDNVITNSTPDGLDDASSNLSAMQTVTDPYPGSAESLPTNLTGEIQRLRYLIKQITGEANWYVDTDTDLAAVVVSLAAKLALAGGTMSGAIAMGTNKITGLGNGTAAQDAAAFNQLKVIQIVQATDATGNTSTSTSFAGTLITGQITPTSSSNRVLVLVSGNLGASNNSNRVYATIDRGGTNIMDATGGGANLLSGSASSVDVPCIMCKVDSPASSSQQTYTVKIRTDNAATTARWNSGASMCTITMIEIV